MSVEDFPCLYSVCVWRILSTENTHDFEFVIPRYFAVMKLEQFCNVLVSEMTDKV